MKLFSPTLLVTCCFISALFTSETALADDYSSAYSSASSGSYFAADAQKKCECMCIEVHFDGSKGGSVLTSSGDSVWIFSVANKSECEVELEGEECRGTSIDGSGDDASGNLEKCNYYTQG